MAFIEYAGRAGLEAGLIREKDSGSPWAYRHKLTPFSVLEDEIYHLRIRMEQIFNREQCLTAPNVVEISTLLDTKINEYMSEKNSKNQ